MAHLTAVLPYIHSKVFIEIPSDQMAHRIATEEADSPFPYFLFHTRFHQTLRRKRQRNGLPADPGDTHFRQTDLPRNDNADVIGKIKWTGTSAPPGRSLCYLNSVPWYRETFL